MSFIDRLEDHAQRTLAVCDDGQCYTYAEALELAHKLDQDVPRRLVFCLCANDAGTLLGYLALLRLRAIPVMLNAAITAEQLDRLVRHYLPAYVWLPQERAAELDKGRFAGAFAGHVLVATGANDQDIAAHPSLALLLATSGSTGSPVFVRQSYQNIASNAASIANYLDLTPDERPITTLPMSYTYGLSIVHSHVLHGCTLALTQRTFFDRGFWDFLKAAQATSFGGVPYHYEILKKLRFSRLDLPSLRTLTQAGGRMEPSLSLEMARHCLERGIRYFTMYGQTEATARMSYLAPEMAIDKAGSIGQPIPGGEFWLEDERGHRLNEPECSGQLVYRGENVCLGYAQNHQDLALGDDNRGVLRTGDLARRDADGYYYIVGRIKRFLKLFGHRVNLQDVEAECLRAGHDVACGGEDDRLVIYIPQAAREACAALKSRVAGQLKAHPTAIVVVGVERLPRNEAGKLLYTELASLPGEVLA